MTRARVLVSGMAGVVATLLAVDSIDAYATPRPDPTPVTASPVPTDTPIDGPTADDPVADPPADGVVVLQTDSGAAAQSGALRDAIERLGGTVRHTFGAQQTVSLQLPATSDPTAASTVAKLAALPGVARVEPPVTRSFDAVPNDPKLPSQRAYLDAVAAPAAWDRQRGSAAVRIAVVDSGVDVGHPDLAGKIVGRYDAVTRSTSVTDTVGHGTFVAGVAAARTGNGVGVAGAGYNTSILAVKVADRYGDIALDDEIAGIRWAADHGADVINLSLSGPDSSTAELRAVQYAQAKGALVVAAAGNESTTTKQYPAAYPGVVAVGATDVAKRRRASFSSHGSWVTLAAPGVNLVSTTPRAGSDYFPGRSGYGNGDGTSFSTPLVAGAAALLFAQSSAMTATRVRAALVASAHGYAGNDLGRGQVDFGLALDHVTPATKPVLVPPLGTTGNVDISSLSTAARVSFRIDAGPWLPSVPVVGGVARLAFSSFGYADGQHTVSAVDCSRFGECNTAAPLRTSTLLLTNPPPSLTVDATVSGPFTASASGPTGGGVRLLVDGTEAAFDAAAPYAFAVNGSLYANGTHQLTVQSCTASHAICRGTQSPATAVTFDSLHPVITGLSRSAISPNGDGSGDTAVLSFRRDQPSDTARIQTRNAAGTVLRSDAVAPGVSSFTWRGLGADGRRLPDATYRVVLVTSDSYDNRHGQAERSVIVDTRAPRVLAVSGNGTRFFPVRDGYHDTFTPGAGLPDGGTVTLTFATSAGRVVRVLRANRGRNSHAALTWNGLSSTGHRVPAGVYRWSLTAADIAGNVTRTGSYRTTVDSRRLLTRTASLVRNAKGKVVGTAKCASKGRSSFRRGAHLVNRCRGGSGEVAYVTYSIAVPRALRYQRLQFAVFGRAGRTSQLSGSFRSNSGGLEVPRGVRIRHSSSRWRTVGSAPAADHLRRGRVTVALVLSTRYAGTNDFDARSVRLRVTLVRLG